MSYQQQQHQHGGYSQYPPPPCNVCHRNPCQCAVPCSSCNYNPCRCPPKEQCVSVCPPPCPVPSGSKNCREQCVDVGCPQDLISFCNICKKDPCGCPKQAMAVAHVCQYCRQSPCACQQAPVDCAPQVCTVCRQSPCACPSIREPIGAEYVGHAVDGHAHGVSVQQQQHALQQISSGGLNALNKKQRITRRFWVTATFSLAQAEADRRVAMWKPLNDKSFSKAPVNAARATARGGNLSACVLAHVAVLQARTEHKPDIGVRMMGMRGNTYTNTGDRYPYVIMGGGQNTTYGPKGQTIFVPKKMIGTVFFSSYAGITDASLDQGVSHIDDNFTLVPIDHIVMHMLRINRNKLPFNIDHMNVIRNRIEMTRQLFDGMKRFVKDKVIDKLPYVNLSCSSFYGTFWRADVPASATNHYTSPDGSLLAACGNKQLYDQWVHVPRTTSLQIEISYMIPSVSKAC